MKQGPVSYVTLITRLQDLRINEQGMFVNVQTGGFRLLWFSCNWWVLFCTVEGGKLRDVQTGLNNNLHAIYGGVQFGRVAWELVSGLSSMGESNGFDLP